MKLRVYSGRQVLRAFAQLGFEEVHRRGSHVKMKHPDGRVLVFPLHDSVDRFTLKGVLRDAEIAIDEFIQALG
jgi:predicted RNA binding protein YcfA (HicA-like mRNA interferase family)